MRRREVEPDDDVGALEHEVAELAAIRAVDDPRVRLDDRLDTTRGVPPASPRSSSGRGSARPYSTNGTPSYLRELLAHGRLPVAARSRDDRPRASQKPGLEGRLGPGLHAIRRRARAESRSPRAARCRRSGGRRRRRPRSPAGTRPSTSSRVHRSPSLLAVVMRARASPPRKPSPSRMPDELRPERVGDAGLEPADHPRAPAAQQRSSLATPGAPRRIRTTRQIARAFAVFPPAT